MGYSFYPLLKWSDRIWWPDLETFIGMVSVAWWWGLAILIVLVPLFIIALIVLLMLVALRDGA